MRFGICTSLENVDRLAEVGYDYIELGVQSALMPEAAETSRVAHPEALIRSKVQCCGMVRKFIATQQVLPLIHSDQVEINQSQFLPSVRHIVNAEYTLAAVMGLSPECKKWSL